MSALATRLSSLEKKTATLDFKDVQIPENSANVLTLLKSNSAAKNATANEWIIDVFPNFIPIVMYVMSLSASMAQLVDHREHAKTSTATIAMYNMCIIYAYFLVSDIFVRPSPSSHAHSWSQTTWKENFVEFLMTLPVPEQLETILQQFAPTVTERRRNVFYIPSAAGFDADQHFGRFFPLSFFSNIHDCTATLPGNSPRHTVLNDLLPRVLYTSNGNTVYLGNLLGFTQSNDHHTAHYVNSKLYQMFSSVFNPVLFRDYQRRSTLATLDIEPVTSSNAYDLLFSATSTNLRELKVVLQSVASIFNGKVSCKTNLAKFISSSSGIQILSHGYSTVPLPTWTSDTLEDLELTAANRSQAASPATRATTLHFLSPPTTRPNRTTHIDETEYIDSTTNAVAPIPNGFALRRVWPFNLVLNADSNRPFPTIATDAENPGSFVFFNPDQNVAPRTLVIDVLGTPSETAYLAAISGKIIETFEIDGCTIEHPREDKSLGMQNALFSDSLIPFRYVMSSRSLGLAQNNRLQPLHRAPANSTQRLPASTHLYDRTKVHISNVNNDVIGTATQHPGLTTRVTDWMHYSLDFIGFRTVSPSSHGRTDDFPPHVDESRLYVFSPYTYTGYSDSGDLTADHTVQRTYFVTNMRSILGNDFPLTEIVHPYEAMPVL